MQKIKIPAFKESAKKGIEFAENSINNNLLEGKKINTLKQKIKKELKQKIKKELKKEHFWGWGDALKWVIQELESEEIWSEMK